MVKHGLGEDAFVDTFDGATGLWHKVRTVIGKVAVGLDGKVTIRWAIPVPKKTPMLLALWIRSSYYKYPDSEAQGQACRQPGRPRAKKGSNNSRQHAQNMWASASHYYSVDKGRGSGVFAKKADGTWSGNPSLSDFMKEYMMCFL